MIIDASKGLGRTFCEGLLNTDDALQVPRAQAARRGNGNLVPVHDVVAVVRCLLALSDASFVRERGMPAIADPRF